MMSLVNDDVTGKQVSELPTALLWDIGKKKIFIMNISEDQSYEEICKRCKRNVGNVLNKLVYDIYEWGDYIIGEDMFMV